MSTFMFQIDSFEQIILEQIILEYWEIGMGWQVILEKKNKFKVKC